MSDYYCRDNEIWSDIEPVGNRKEDACDAFNVFACSGMEILPYHYGDNIDQNQVLFTDRYITLVGIGLMTGDISGMNDAEKTSFRKFVDYEDGHDGLFFTPPAYFTGDDLIVSQQLDECLVQAVYGNETVQCGSNDGTATCCPF